MSLSKKASEHSFKRGCKDCDGQHYVLIDSEKNVTTTREEICPYCHDVENCDFCKEEGKKESFERNLYLDGRNRKG
jgi:hypothetical protein